MEVDNGEPTLDRIVPPSSDSSTEKTPVAPPARNCRNIQTPGGESGDGGRKKGGPEPVKVPKAFCFPERYMSPTDRLISPVSKGVLARNRKTGPMIPPGNIPPTIRGSRFQSIDPFQA